MTILIQCKGTLNSRIGFIVILHQQYAHRIVQSNSYIDTYELKFIGILYNVYSTSVYVFIENYLCTYVLYNITYKYYIKWVVERIYYI